MLAKMRELAKRWSPRALIVVFGFPLRCAEVKRVSGSRLGGKGRLKEKGDECYPGTMDWKGLSSGFLRGTGPVAIRQINEGALIFFPEYFSGALIPICPIVESKSKKARRVQYTSDT
ncbi:hypothetical protein HNY73_021616 [Argiope bruennichi]|uniref:Uncharacterized protein n=1 Tax=Argiope bruennichi TaxID=94029 RepID=A0A8T0DZP2_ARGBR|nr:hypothetical protein HNY73_021616 [Argiope bruennichi]